MKNTIKMVVGILCLFALGNVNSISFSTGEGVGYSVFTIGAIILGVYLIYSGAKGMRNERNKPPGPQLPLSK